jgi:uncharacterized OsmC-like protein
VSTGRRLNLRCCGNSVPEEDPAMTATTIGEAIRRAREYLRQRPGEAAYVDSTATATVEAGLRCRVAGPHGAVVVSDMPEGVGGAGSAPSPGWLLRAAHAACDATLIAMRAAEEGIELSRLEVVVDSDSDDRGLLGMDDTTPAGPIRTRVRIMIAAGSVPEAKLREVVRWARDHSPVDDALQRAVEVSLEVTVAAS